MWPHSVYDMLWWQCITCWTCKYHKQVKWPKRCLWNLLLSADTIIFGTHHSHKERWAINVIRRRAKRRYTFASPGSQPFKLERKSMVCITKFKLSVLLCTLNIPPGAQDPPGTPKKVSLVILNTFYLIFQTHLRVNVSIHFSKEREREGISDFAGWNLVSSKSLPPPPPVRPLQGRNTNGVRKPFTSSMLYFLPVCCIDYGIL